MHCTVDFHSAHYEPEDQTCLNRVLFQIVSRVVVL